MALAGSAVVTIWNDITDELREDFFEWHPRQHMPERLGVPGFLRGRRCIALDEGVEFFTLYEVAGPDVLDSECYRQRLANPTDWSLKVMPGFRNNVRGGCRILYSAGWVMGAYLMTLRFSANASQTEPQLTSALVSKVLPALTAFPRVAAVHLCKNDPLLSGGQVGARQGRVITQPDLVLIVETIDLDSLKSVRERFFDDETLVNLGVNTGWIWDRFGLEYSLQKIARE